MFSSRVWRGVAFVVALCAGVAVAAQSPAHRTAPRSVGAAPKVADFLPEGAANVQKLRVDFNHDGSPAALVLVYELPVKDDPDDHLMDTRVLQYSRGSGWKVAFEDSDEVENGGGESVVVDRMTGTSGKQGLMMTTRYSGAGTAASWRIIAVSGGEFVKIDPWKIRQKVLDSNGYEDWGYNTLKVRGPLVIESQPGYSHDTARCCPDRPSLLIVVRFTGSVLELVSAKKQPFTPKQY